MQTDQYINKFLNDNSKAQITKDEVKMFFCTFLKEMRIAEDRLLTNNDLE
jgi:hypothetical protein